MGRQVRGFLITCFLLAPILAVGMFLGWSLGAVLSPRAMNKVTCLKARVLVPNAEWGVMLSSEQLLCGRELRWSPIFGPDIATHLKKAEQRIAELEERN